MTGSPAVLSSEASSGKMRKCKKDLFKLKSSGIEKKLKKPPHCKQKKVSQCKQISLRLLKAFFNVGILAFSGAFYVFLYNHKNDISFHATVSIFRFQISM